jgi:hypothetical protein
MTKSTGKNKSRSKSRTKHAKSVHRTKVKSGRKSHAKSKGKSIASKHKGEIITFYCCKCKKSTKAPVKKIDKIRKEGGSYSSFAKGNCGKCETKMSTIVKNTGD